MASPIRAWSSAGEGSLGCAARREQQHRRRPVQGNGKQTSAQLAFVDSLWRLGLAANFNAQPGDAKSAYGIFGGLRTGPISWLAQAEITDDQSIPNDQGKQLAALLEANWLIARGNNLKITGEFLNPNRAVPNGEETRWSLVYELTPIQFVQLRAGFRWNDGIRKIHPNIKSCTSSNCTDSSEDQSGEDRSGPCNRQTQPFRRPSTLIEQVIRDTRSHA